MGSLYFVIKMASFHKVLVGLVLLSAVNARPSDYDSPNQLESESTIDLDDGNLESAEKPRLYLIIAEAADELETDGPAAALLEKRSAEEIDDLETAAGTNVLRPLFVYRQQLAYRERVKKGASRRVGIRPRF